LFTTRLTITRDIRATRLKPPGVGIRRSTNADELAPLYRLGLHVRPQNRVDAGLVAAAGPLEPFHDIMVNPDGQTVPTKDPLHSGDSVAGASCIDPSAHKERGPSG
jgi:hypothetical protein